MTLTEAYEALLKMPLRHRITVFSEGARTERGDSISMDFGSDSHDEIVPAKWPYFMTIVAGDA